MQAARTSSGPLSCIQSRKRRAHAPTGWHHSGLDAMIRPGHSGNPIRTSAPLTSPARRAK